MPVPPESVPSDGASPGASTRLAARRGLATAIVLVGVVLVVVAGRAGLLGPSSRLLLLALACAFGACAVILARAGGLALRLLSAAGALLAGMAVGVGVVNNYYDYYQSWSALGTDLSADNGAGAGVAVVPIGMRGADGGVGPTASRGALGPGRLESISLPGPVSGVHGRQALVWLPPQYDQRRYAATRFPVLMLVHGEPGKPQNWTTGLGLPEVLNQQYASGTSNPMVVVMPEVAGQFPRQQCLDATQGGPRLDTYLGTDVPRDIASQLRVSPPGRHWAVGGLSAGGFCAARLALRYPRTFGAAAVMDGYFHPDLNQLARRQLFGSGPVPATADPTTLLARFPAGRPLPAFWIMGGTGNASDYRNAITFATSVGEREDLRFLTVIGGRHTAPAWRRSLPDLLRWAGAVVNGRPAFGQTALPL